MNFQGFGKDGANAKTRIEGVVGVLEDHLDLLAVGAKSGAIQRGDFLAVVKGGAGGGVLETDENPAEGGLAGAAFADEAKGGTLVDFQGDVVECLDHAGLALEQAGFHREIDRQVTDFDEGRHRDSGVKTFKVTRFCRAAFHRGHGPGGAGPYRMMRFGF